MRVTMAVAITADGHWLPPYFVYKGKRGGRISREFSTYPQGAFYSVQENAWMDETGCLEWVDKVVVPWANAAPQDVIPLLMLDSYKCHLLQSVVTVIQDLGVEVEHIPGGLTGLCQPIDVGIN